VEMYKPGKLREFRSISNTLHRSPALSSEFTLPKSRLEGYPNFLLHSVKPSRLVSIAGKAASIKHTDFISQLIPFSLLRVEVLR